MIENRLRIKIPQEYLAKILQNMTRDYTKYEPPNNLFAMDRIRYQKLFW